MPMTQQDIRSHYEQQWKKQSDDASNISDLSYSNPIEDAVLYPAYVKLIRDFGLAVSGGRVLDVGSGSGRWIRFFTERFKPRSLLGIDFSASSIELLNKWGMKHDGCVEFRQADITEPDLDLGGGFDLINVANVLFHIPEPDRYARALANLTRHLLPDGAIVTTEYLPRRTMRTEWMLVRSRYEFQAIAEAAGLEIAGVRAVHFFANDPMGIDGLDEGLRKQFSQVRANMNSLLASNLDPQTRKFMLEFLVSIEQTAIDFSRERIADMELPGQKLVVLRKKG